MTDEKFAKYTTEELKAALEEKRAERAEALKYMESAEHRNSAEAYQTARYLFDRCADVIYNILCALEDRENGNV